MYLPHQDTSHFRQRANYGELEIDEQYLPIYFSSDNDKKISSAIGQNRGNFEHMLCTYYAISMHTLQLEVDDAVKYSKNS